MTSHILSSMHIPVCQVPSGNGFRIEHMPEFLANDDFGNCSPHVHSFYEILWFQEGSGIHTVDFAEYEVRPNTIFFLSPGQVHHFDNAVNYRGVSIKMCTDFMKNESNLFLKYNVFYSHDTLPYYSIDAATARTLSALVDEMEAESTRSDQFGNTEILQSLLRIFLVNIQRHGLQNGQKPLSSLKPSHQLFIAFRRLVEKEHRRMHTVQEYASELNVSVRTLNKCVNECSSMSPLCFINERIILEAKRMVRYTNLMFKEIGYALGYDDPSYFVKFFKRQTGYLPSDFRELEHVTHSHPRSPKKR